MAAVLAGPAPLTVVPDDAIPSGIPAVIAEAPIVGPMETMVNPPKCWDLATAASFVDLFEEVPVARGTWTVDDTGRLHKTGPGNVTVATKLDAERLESTYAEVFG
jgi:hypothetical protein